MLSPSLLEKVSYVGTLLKSFRQGDVAIEKLLDISLGHDLIIASTCVGQRMKSCIWCH